MTGLDAPTAALVDLAAAIAVADEAGMNARMQQAMRAGTPPEWIEELILQSYLFAGFPRTLNAARAWRTVSGRPAPPAEPSVPHDRERWRRDGERTCAIVYGASYERLRQNVRALHPQLDEWMIVEGYGKVLSRAALDLARRELCIVAVCAATAQERQLRSHLRGALHAGATPAQLRDVLARVIPPADSDRSTRYHRLLERAQEAT